MKGYDVTTGDGSFWRQGFKITVKITKNYSFEL